MKAAEFPFVFQALLTADINSGSTLRIRKGDEELWARHAPTSRPSIENLSASIRENTLVIDWNIQQTDGQATELWLQWSDDDGKNWYGLSVGLLGKRAEFSHIARYRLDQFLYVCWLITDFIQQRQTQLRLKYQKYIHLRSL